VLLVRPLGLSFLSMKIIPTNYRGITYRSRTEARWAVVFDELGWHHFYEPEGYALPSGYYLPDFYLPQQEAFFEVKGRKPTWKEIKLADELTAATGSIVIVSHGPPDHRRSECDRDLSIFYPAMSVDDKLYADWQEGGFVSGRFDHHPKCSIDLGNLVHLGCKNDIDWQTAFARSANHRFGVYS
jgi:hypothetical protein